MSPAAESDPDWVILQLSPAESELTCTRGEEAGTDDSGFIGDILNTSSVDIIRG